MPPSAEPVEKTVLIEPTIVPQGESAQPPEAQDRWTPEHSLAPPEDLDNLAALTQAARSRRSCIEAVALTSAAEDRHQELSLSEQWRDFPAIPHDDKLDGVDVLVRTALEHSHQEVVHEIG